MILIFCDTKRTVRFWDKGMIVDSGGTNIGGNSNGGGGCAEVDPYAKMTLNYWDHMVTER